MTVSLHLRLAVAAHYSEEARSLWLNNTDVEWEQLTQEAIVNRLAPLLYHSLKKFPRSDVTATSLELLRTVYYATAARNMQMHQQLKRVTDALDEIGVHYILLKGAALIQDVYDGNMALRPMSDIDVLIDSSDFPLARQSLEKFSRLEAVIMDDDANVIQHARAFYPAKNTRIEIHTRLLRYYYYANRPKINVLTKLDKLDSNWTFLYLCAHALQHHEGGNSLFGSDASFISQLSLHWPTIISLAQDNHMISSLQWGVEMLVEYWFVHIPDDVQFLINRLEASYSEQFFLLCSQKPILRRFGTWISLPNFQTKLIYLLRMMFPTKTYLEDRWANGETLPVYRLYLRRFVKIPVRLTGRRI